MLIELALRINRIVGSSAPFPPACGNAESCSRACSKSSLLEQTTIVDETASVRKTSSMKLVTSSALTTVHMSISSDTNRRRRAEI